MESKRVHDIVCYVAVEIKWAASSALKGNALRAGRALRDLPCLEPVLASA